MWSCIRSLNQSRPTQRLFNRVVSLLFQTRIVQVVQVRQQAAQDPVLPRMERLVYTLVLGVRGDVLQPPRPRVQV